MNIHNILTSPVGLFPNTPWGGGKRVSTRLQGTLDTVCPTAEVQRDIVLLSHLQYLSCVSLCPASAQRLACTVTGGALVSAWADWQPYSYTAGRICGESCLFKLPQRLDGSVQVKI